MAIPNQEFSAQNLQWMRRYKKQFGLKPDSGVALKDESDWKKYLDELDLKIGSDSLLFLKLHTFSVRKGSKLRTILSTKSLDESLALRKINDNIRRSYGLRNASRHDLISTVKQAISENTTKQILRLDIKSCFESVERSKVLKIIRDDGLVSLQTSVLLKRIIDKSQQLSPKLDRKGLPRGLAVSGSLAEVYLKEIESKIKRLGGVYLCIRYVDDIMIFSSSTDPSLKDKVSQILAGHGLHINRKKTKDYLIACECANSCKHGNSCPCVEKCSCAPDPTKSKVLEYLGYSLVIPNGNHKSKHNPVKVELSSSKITKTKTRIALAVKSYIKAGDYMLLRKRIEYLTGNQMMLSSAGRRGLLSGVAYSHSAYDFDPKNEDPGANSLRNLDDYLQSTLRYGFRKRPLPKNLKKDVIGMTFVSGFAHKRRTKFDAATIKAINKVWSNA